MWIILVYQISLHQSIVVMRKDVRMALKPGPKRIAVSTGKVDQRLRDNKSTPGNTNQLKAPKR